MAGLVVVDASLAVKWLLPEQFAPEASVLAEHWETHQIEMVAVHLLPMEVANALHRKVVQGTITATDAARLISSFLSYNVRLIYQQRLHARATELASELRQGAVYDAHYLALAETLGCELWTADQRFQGVAGAAGHPVHWVGDFAIAGPR